MTTDRKDKVKQVSWGVGGALAMAITFLLGSESGRDTLKLLLPKGAEQHTEQTRLLTVIEERQRAALGIMDRNMVMLADRFQQMTYAIWRRSPIPTNTVEIERMPQ